MLHKEKWFEYISFAALAIIAAYFAYKNYFIQDDAYIAFVYAKNFAHGNGLVWYPGLDEYGYTNFLYTLIVGTVMFWLPGIDPEYISAPINFTSYLAALTLTYFLTLRLSGSKLAGACAVLILATHHTFSAYASGGLETMTVTALILGFYYVLFSNRSTLTTRHYALAALASAALLTRLDSAILLFPGYVYLLWRHCDEHLATKQSSFAAITATMTNKSLWLAAGIPTLCVLALLSWAKLYYGYALPNTFYAKIPGDTSMVWLGKRYILKYLELHHYIPAALLVAAIIILICHSERMRGILKIPRQAQGNSSESRIPNPLFAPLLTLLATMSLWLSYVVYVGGCFMEFRLLVPILPMFAVVVFVAIGRLDKKKLLVLMCLLFSISSLYGNYQHVSKFTLNKPFIAWVDQHIGNIDSFYKYITIKGVNWRVIGLALNKHFFTGSPMDVKLATFPAGVIPFYSNLRSLDAHGLNARKILLDSSYRRPNINGVHPPNPGHMMVGNDAILEEEGMDLNIYHPQTLCVSTDGIYRLTQNVPFRIPFTRHRTIMIPINDRCYLVADYLTHHPRIEELLSNGTILDYRTNQDKFHCPRWLCLR